MKTSVKDITKNLSNLVFEFWYFYTYIFVIQVFNIAELKDEFYAANSQNVYSIVYTNKKPTSRILVQVVGYQLWAQLGSGPTV